MQNVPKIVRERLKAASPAVDHPDADVLTAFTERSLAADERSVVLAHLARCGDCRDILALSLPATEPVERAVQTPATGWLAWPVLRWGFVAAGILAIASIGVVQYRRDVRSRSIASNAPADFDVTAKEARNQLMASPASTVKNAEKIESPGAPAFADSVDAKKAPVKQPARMLHAEAPPAPIPPSANSGRSGLSVGGPLPHGPRLANQWQQQNGVQNQIATPAASSPFAKQQAAGDLSAKMQVPAVSQTVTVESPATQFDTLYQNQDARQNDVRQNKDQPSAPLQSSEDYDAARVGKAKPAEAAATASIVAPALSVPTPSSSGVTGGAALTLLPPVPRWTITTAGGLQRSFDQGSTWQDVDVNTTPVSATSLQISVQTSRAKVKARDREKSAQKSAATFRAVAANGPDVWAGGSGGALYHSPDAGDHWTHVMPTSAGAVLTGNIVSLEFTDILHGRVSTSTAEVWITSDAGQTWQKQ
jgi:hypothetical protein